MTGRGLPPASWPPSLPRHWPPCGAHRQGLLTDHRQVQVCHNDAQVAQALQAWQAYDGQGAAPSILAAKPPKTLASLWGAAKSLKVRALLL